MIAMALSCNPNLIVADENGVHRLFEISGGRMRGKKLMMESDIERHKRYDLGMDTSMVFTVRESGQYIVSWRWKVMRQLSELVRFVVDQARISEYKMGLQSATVWLRGAAEKCTAFPIDDIVTEEVYESLLHHQSIVSAERNGDWFTIIAKF